MRSTSRTFFQFFLKRGKVSDSAASEDDGASDNNSGAFYPVIRMPVELTWGCDLFLFWMVLDLYHRRGGPPPPQPPPQTAPPQSEVIPQAKVPLRLSEYCNKNESPVPTDAPSRVHNDTAWTWKHRVNIGLSLFSLVTLFEYTVNLRPLYRRLSWWWQNMRQSLLDSILRAAL